MAVKPRSEWSTAYRHRVERNEAKGKTRQQSRGHKVLEHKSRKSRSELTTQQREYIKRFHRRQLKRLDHRDGSLDQMMDYAKRYGFARFRSIVKTQSSLMKARKRANTPVSRKRYIKSGGKLSYGRVPLGAGMTAAIASLSRSDYGYETAEEGWDDIFAEDAVTIEWLRYG